MKRDWSEARAKVDAEGRCRVCGWGEGLVKLEAAHVISRAQGGTDDPRGIVPLCWECHRAFDARRLDLLPFLMNDEQAYAVSLVGIVSAYRRLTGERDV